MAWIMVLRKEWGDHYDVWAQRAWSMVAELPPRLQAYAEEYEVAGFAVIEPLHPIRDVWHLVAHSAQYPGLMLVGVFAAPPDPRSPRLGLPGGYHPGTRRLIHCWKADAALPDALSL